MSLPARVKAFPEVESVCLMSGGFDLAVTVTANTMSEIAMFVAKRLAADRRCAFHCHALYSDEI